MEMEWEIGELQEERLKINISKKKQRSGNGMNEQRSPTIWTEEKHFENWNNDLLFEWQNRGFQVVGFKINISR